MFARVSSLDIFGEDGVCYHVLLASQTLKSLMFCIIQCKLNICISILKCIQVLHILHTDRRFQIQKVAIPVIIVKKSLFLYSKTCVKGHIQKDRKLVFKIDYCLMLVKSIAECSKWSILQCFQPSLSYMYQLSLRPLFCLFLSGRFTQVLLYFLQFQFLVGLIQHSNTVNSHSPHVAGLFSHTDSGLPQVV